MLDRKSTQIYLIVEEVYIIAEEMGGLRVFLGGLKIGLNDITQSDGYFDHRSATLWGCAPVSL